MRLLIALYPRAVRERYGAEIAELLRVSDRPVRDRLNIVWHALVERVGEVRHVNFGRLGFGAAAFAALAVLVTAIADMVDRFLFGSVVNSSHEVGVGIALGLIAVVFAVSGILAGHALGRSGKLPTALVPIGLAALLYLHDVIFFTGYSGVEVRYVALSGATTMSLFWLAGVVLLGLLARRWGSRAGVLACLAGGVLLLHVRLLYSVVSVDVATGNPWLSYVRSVLLIPVSGTTNGSGAQAPAVASAASAVLLTFATAFGLAYLRAGRAPEVSPAAA